MVWIPCLGLSPCYLLIPVWSWGQKPLPEAKGQSGEKPIPTWLNYGAHMFKRKEYIYTGLPPGSPTASRHHWGQVLQNTTHESNTWRLILHNSTPLALNCLWHEHTRPPKDLVKRQISKTIDLGRGRGFQHYPNCSRRGISERVLPHSTTDLGKI